MNEGERALCIRSISEVISSNYASNLKSSSVRTSKFEDVLKGKRNSEKVSMKDMFSAVFSTMNTIVKEGNCTVSKANWEKNDFPIWKYFNKNTSGDSLNNWRPSGKDYSMADSYVQNGLNSIGFGEMAIVIPESVQQKMKEDSAYAKKILKDISDWKENYDRRDNAVAASYGFNVPLYQYSKSYCIKLDENGQIDDYTIVSGGIDFQNHNFVMPYEDYKEVLIKKKGIKSIDRRILCSAVKDTIENNSMYDYTYAMSALASGYSQTRKK